MTTRWTMTLLVFTAAVAFALGRFSARCDSTGLDPARDLNPARLVSSLGLSEAQAAELEQLNQTYAKQVGAACDTHCAARCQLSQALRKDTLSREEARAVVERMCASQQQNEMATLDHILGIRNVLTPEQRLAFANTIGDCLCSTCQADKTSCCANSHRE